MVHSWVCILIEEIYVLNQNRYPNTGMQPWEKIKENQETLNAYMLLVSNYRYVKVVKE